MQVNSFLYELRKAKREKELLICKCNRCCNKCNRRTLKIGKGRKVSYG